MTYDRDEIIERDGYQCQRCEQRFADSRPLEVSHDVPRADGGSDGPENLETLCIGCHSEKDGWTVGDFGNAAHRARRVCSYIRHVEGLRGAAKISRAGALLGVSYSEAADLIDKHL